MMDYMDYLDSIGITTTLQKRVKDIIDWYSDFLKKDKLINIFVSDYYDDDGNRNFGSLWILFNDKICEARNFIREIDFDCAPLIKTDIIRWELKSKEGDVDDFNNDSRLAIDVMIENGLTCELKATSNNCYKLMEFMKGAFIQTS